MARNINCLISEHTDNRPSAILNDSADDRFPIGIVHCFSCGAWYHQDDPEMHFYSYEDLAQYLKDYSIEGSAESKQKYKKYKRVIKDTNGEVIEPFPTIRPTVYQGPFSGHKSRIILEGKTLKSCVKDDTFIETEEGKIIYPNKTPRIAPDTVGTHETVKEFMWNENKDTISVSKGFYNRFAVDSDDTSTPLEHRLEKICRTAKISGFWLILNKNNNKFQANISLSRTVCSGYDITRLRHVAKCLNDIAGDPCMTNSIMKNHKVFAKKDSEGLIYGAQPTETYGFDYQMYLDYQDYLSLKSPQDKKNSRWNTIWNNKISSGEIKVEFIKSDRKTGSGTIIPLIVPPRDIKFSIRKDKTWAQPLEVLWKNTVLNYARIKKEHGNTVRLMYSEEHEYSSLFKIRQETNSLAIGILKDMSSEEEVSLVKDILNKNPKIRFRIDRFCDYYKPQMHHMNVSKASLKPKASKNRITGELFFDMFGSKEIMASVVAAIKSYNKDYGIPNWREDTFKSCWSSIVNRCEGTIDEVNLSKLHNLSNMSAGIVVSLVDIFESVSYTFGPSLFDGVKIEDLPTPIKQYVSIATELVWNDALNVVHFGFKDSTIKSLMMIKELDFEFYSSLMISYIVGNIANWEELDYCRVVDNRMSGNRINDINKESKKLIKKNGFKPRISKVINWIKEEESMRFLSNEDEEINYEDFDENKISIKSESLYINEKFLDKFFRINSSEYIRENLSSLLLIFSMENIINSINKYLWLDSIDRSKKNRRIIYNCLSREHLVSLISNILYNTKRNKDIYGEFINKEDLNKYTMYLKSYALVKREKKTHSVETKLDRSVIFKINISRLIEHEKEKSNTKTYNSIFSYDDYPSSMYRSSEKEQYSQYERTWDSNIDSFRRNASLAWNDNRTKYESFSLFDDDDFNSS